MTFLPGSCYAGAGVYPETRAYMSTMSTTSTACPDPADTLGCYEYQVEQTIKKLSFGIPLAFNAFVWLTIRPGMRAEWGSHADEVLGRLEEEASEDYAAAAFLTGCGGYNAVFEVLSSDHQRLQRTIRLLTDLEYVEDVMVGHLAADDAKGFGDPEARAAAR
jgi:hypothetical protein